MAKKAKKTKPYYCPECGLKTVETPSALLSCPKGHGRLLMMPRIEQVDRRSGAFRVWRAAGKDYRKEAKNEVHADRTLFSYPAGGKLKYDWFVPIRETR